MSTTSSTPFTLGVFAGNPNSGDSGAEASFDATNQAFDSLMGTTPTVMNSYIDYTQAPSEWAGNNAWSAGSAAASPSFKGEIPMIALPMGSTSPNAPSGEQILQNFADGSYDGMLQTMVKSWASDGFMTQYWRPGVEMNLVSSPDFVGGSASLQALWISAFQHIYTTLHAAAAADGVTMKVIWNPGLVNGTPAGNATETMWPGKDYVDVVGGDIYGDVGLYSLYDWAANGEKYGGSIYDSSVAQFASNPINLEHYYSYPAATATSSDGSGGVALSLPDLVKFAEAQGLPIAVCETGAGNTGDGANLSDNTTFPAWEASVLATATVPITVVSIWDDNGGGNYAFTGGAKPNEAAAWAKYFGAQSTTVTPPVAPHAASAAHTQVNGTTGTIYDTSGNAWTITSGQQIAENGTVIPSSAHVSTLFWTGTALDQLNTGGNWWTQPLNGSAGTELTAAPAGYAAPATVATTMAALVKEPAVETASAASTVTATPVAATPDTLTLQMSEDAYNGDAQFTVSVDGKQVGGDYTTSALHSSGDAGTFNLTGDWGSGVNNVQVSFINDANGGTAGDRNLYVDSIAKNGVTYAGTTASMTGNSTDTFAVGGTTPTGTAPADDLTLHLSDDAWQGNADFVLYIDGKAVTTPQVVSALHDAHATQGFSFSGNLGAGSHTIGIGFTNDAHGASAGEDRNLYINGITLNGSDVFSGVKAQDSNGISNFTLTTTH